MRFFNSKQNLQSKSTAVLLLGNLFPFFFSCSQLNSPPNSSSGGNGTDSKLVMFSSTPLNISLTEGDNYLIAVALNHPAPSATEVSWSISSGESDFVHSQGTIPIPKGASSFDFDLQAINDTVSEGTKTLSLYVIGSDNFANSLLILIQLTDDDTSPPPDPLSLMAAATSSTTIDLSWTSGGGTTAHYRLAYQTGSSAPSDCSSGTVVSESSISGTNHSLSGLNPDTQYSIRLCSLNGNDTPDLSTGITASATTDTAPDTSGPGSIIWIVKPDKAYPISSDHVFLAWSGQGIDDQFGVRDYEIQWFSSSNCSGTPLSTSTQTEAILWHQLQLGSNSVLITAYDQGNHRGVSECSGGIQYSPSSALVSGFGTNGVRFYDTSFSNVSFDDSLALPNDQVIVSGWIYMGKYPEPLLGRLNSDGSWDTSFGGEGTGYRRLYIPNGAHYDSWGYSIDRQADGKIVQVGYSEDQPQGFVARYLDDGKLDPDFADGGLRVMTIGSTYTRLYGVKALSNGKVVATGSVNNGGNDDVIVFQLTQSGKLDPSFNGVGYMTFDISGQDTHGFAITEGPNQSLIVGGSKNSWAQLFVARITSSGILDSSFGSSSGYTSLNPSTGSDEIHHIQVLANGKILGSGNIEGCGLLVQFDANGMADASFGTSGIVEECAVAGGAFEKAVVLSNNKIVAIGGFELHAAQFLNDGTLDSSFGSGGISDQLSPATYDYGESGTVLSNGEIVIVGSRSNTSLNSALLGVFNADGSAKASFGTNGLQAYQMGKTHEEIAGLKVRPGTDQIVIGLGLVAAYGWNYGLVQTDSNGDLDLTFAGGTGKGTYDISDVSGDNIDQMTSLFLRADGSLIATGLGWRNGSDMTVGSWTSAGVLDSAFDSDGILNLNQSGSQWASGINVQGDGKILLAGGSANDVRIVRLTTSGALDTTFNGTGLVTTNLGGTYYEEALAVAEQADNMIVAVGTKDESAGVIIRYTSTGALDAGFNSTGTITVDRSSDGEWLSDLYIQPDGKIVTFGREGAFFVVSRYNTDGSVDTSFGSRSGYSKITPDGIATSANSRHMLVLSDGSLLLVGSITFNSNSRDLFIAKVNSLGVLDTSFNSTGILTLNFGGSDEEAVEAGELSDGKVVVGFRTNREDQYDFGLIKINP